MGLIYLANVAWMVLVAVQLILKGIARGGGALARYHEKRREK